MEVVGGRTPEVLEVATGRVLKLSQASPWMLFLLEELGPIGAIFPPIANACISLQFYNVTRI